MHSFPEPALALVEAMTALRAQQEEEQAKARQEALTTRRDQLLKDPASPVGGNIDGVTRVMTTAIALETSKGDLPLALALGIVLMAVVGALNLLVDLAYALLDPRPRAGA